MLFNRLDLEFECKIQRAIRQPLASCENTKGLQWVAAKATLRTPIDTEGVQRVFVKIVTIKGLI